MTAFAILVGSARLAAAEDNEPLKLEKTAIGTVLADPDGLQWADEGKPLYRFSKDKKLGNIPGNSVPGWHAVREEADGAPAISRRRTGRPGSPARLPRGHSDGSAWAAASSAAVAAAMSEIQPNQRPKSRTTCITGIVKPPQ